MPAKVLPWLQRQKFFIFAVAKIFVVAEVDG
jgi:hypothetical protein